MLVKGTYLHTWALCVAFDPWSFSTDLMTPTATVCFRSLAAKRPVETRGTSQKDAQQREICMKKLIFYLKGGM